ncbi:MAG: hypothetical protein CL678_15930 [Bdellovibrionaceae bacterium]|nr:hypothetical protein [Pseudobdellovibrionaceae bacterium]
MQIPLVAVEIPCLVTNERFAVNVDRCGRCCHDLGLRRQDGLEDIAHRFNDFTETTLHVVQHVDNAAIRIHLGVGGVVDAVVGQDALSAVFQQCLPATMDLQGKLLREGRIGRLSHTLVRRVWEVVIHQAGDELVLKSDDAVGQSVFFLLGVDLRRLVDPVQQSDARQVERVTRDLELRVDAVEAFDVPFELDFIDIQYVVEPRVAVFRMESNGVHTEQVTAKERNVVRVLIGKADRVVSELLDEVPINHQILTHCCKGCFN